MNHDDQNLVEDLTDAQRRAVQTTEGPVLVLAAAGSGKTRVITRRVAALVRMGVPAWQILALTFTNKAAGEMRERVHTLLAHTPESDAPLAPTAVRGLTVSTFHALCARLLRRYAPLMDGKPRWAIAHDYTIYDTADQQALLKRVIADAGLSTSNWSPRSVLSAISAAKNEMKDADVFEAEANDFYAKAIAKLYSAYQAGLHAANAVDFDDLLLLTVRLLRESNEARDEVQQRWRYLMIDEYQDTNRVQFELTTLLVGAERDRPPNICVVGDPDQSIYGWRGADISNILGFEERYPTAAVIALGQNFRSTAPILATADHLIRHNRQRKHKDLFTTNEGGAKPKVTLCRDEHHEASLVVDWCRAHREHHEPLAWKDMAVFYRNNALSRVLEDACRTAGIPYVIARGTAFYQREEVKDAIAYLRLLANRADDVSLRRIINKPARKIGKAALQRLEEHAADNQRPLADAVAHAAQGAVDDISAVAKTGIRAFTEMIDRWTGAGSFMGADVSGSLSELVDRVIKESGLERHYQTLAKKSRAETDEAKLDNLLELVSSAQEFEREYDITGDPALTDTPAAANAGEPLPDPDAPPLLAMLRAFLESVSLVADADQADPAVGAVTLMTLHAAKGLEFPAVAIVGLEEGLLPSMRAIESEEQLEEERRLAFVGITRAMSHLLITSARYRTQRGVRDRTIPSRFLGELPDQHVEVSDQSEQTGLDQHAAGAWDDFEFDQTDPADRLTRAAAAAQTPTQRGRSALSPGALVRHPQFGVGRIVEITGLGAHRRARVDFRDVGAKTLVLEYARLEPVPR